MPSTNKSTRVIVFAKAPEPGVAKTRLIPLLGTEGAAALHARLIEHTLATAQDAALGALELHGTPGDDEFLRLCAARYNAVLVAQSGGDLGARMLNAFQNALSADVRPLLIGSDCPALTARHLRRAGQALADGHDAVFIPTEDGGYALIGVSRCDERLFLDVEWSTSQVMATTRSRLNELGWRWTELDMLWDVDRPADYERLIASGILKGDVRLSV